MWVINDLETQNHPWYGATASPHCPDNYIVATGWAIDNGPVQHEYFNSKEESLKSDWLARILSGNQVYVAHNASYEISWLLKNHFDVFSSFIRNGGRVFCTQYAEYLLTAQQEQYATLEDCSVKYRDVGMDENEVRKIDEVKILWNQGVLTADIDKALLLSYLTDDKHGDVANTRRVCYKQFELLKEKGMIKMFWKRMDSLIFNAWCSFNGLYVDMERAQANLERQLKEIDEIKESIKGSVPVVDDPYFEFKLSSRFHVSALLFGGTLTYDSKVPYDTPTFVKGDFIKFKDGARYQVADKDLIDPAWVAELELKHGDVVRFKSGVNKGKVKDHREDTDEVKLKWGDRTVKLDGLIKFSDLPSHVSELYIGKRAEYQGKQSHKACGTPIYSTSDESLEILSKFTDLAKPLSRLATLIKDTGTYYLMTDDKGKTSGMLQYVEPDGIVHHQLNNCATITSRLSSSRPNFQNLPRGDGNEAKGQFKSRVKENFISRFGPNGRIVEVDYTALEVVNAATITGDKNLLEQLHKGTDMHCYRLAFKEGLEYEDVLNRCKNPEYPEYPEWDAKRTAIKTPSFADQYGASEYGVAYAAGCSVEFAREFQANEALLFPDLKAFPKKVLRPEIERTGLLGLPRREQDPKTGVWSMYRIGYFQAKSGTIYSFKQKLQRREGQQVMDYKNTEIANYPFQGESAFIVQAACGHVMRWLVDNEFFGGQVLMINTVHDAIYLDCATEELAIMAGAKVREIMAATPAQLAEYIPELKDWNYHTTPFPAAAEQGADMGNKVAIPK